eukprot:352354-Chlamydomonas_euryale.AAC.2
MPVRVSDGQSRQLLLRENAACCLVAGTKHSVCALRPLSERLAVWGRTSVVSVHINKPVTGRLPSSCLSYWSERRNRNGLDVSGRWSCTWA